MLVINNSTKTLILNRNVKYHFKKATSIEFEFVNPLYNQIYDVERSYLEGDFIYVIGKFNKTYKNLFPHEGDILEYIITINRVEDNLFE